MAQEAARRAGAARHTGADFPAETTVFRIFYDAGEDAAEGAGSMA